MTALDFRFQPQQVKISTEEILADLNYPAPAGGRTKGRKPVSSRGKQRA